MTLQEMMDNYKAAINAPGTEYIVPWCEYYVLWACDTPEKAVDLLTADDNIYITVHRIMQIGIDNGIHVGSPELELEYIQRLLSGGI